MLFVTTQLLVNQSISFILYWRLSFVHLQWPNWLALSHHFLFPLNKPVDCVLHGVSGAWWTSNAQWLVLHGLYFYFYLCCCVCHMSSINLSLRRLVELHFPNFFGQCLNERTFIKRRRRLYLNFAILVITWIVYLTLSTQREGWTNPSPYKIFVIFSRERRGYW